MTSLEWGGSEISQRKQEKAKSEWSLLLTRVLRFRCMFKFCSGCGRVWVPRLQQHLFTHLEQRILGEKEKGRVVEPVITCDQVWVQGVLRFGDLGM
jgi:hypothetical protein